MEQQQKLAPACTANLFSNRIPESKENGSIQHPHTVLLLLVRSREAKWTLQMLSSAQALLECMELPRMSSVSLLLSTHVTGKLVSQTQLYISTINPHRRVLVTKYLRTAGWVVVLHLASL